MRFLLYFALVLLGIYAFTSKAFALDLANTPITLDKRIRYLIYSENIIYEIKFGVQYQSIIELANEETVETISIGEPGGWKITPIGRRVFIKPTEVGAVTNMTILTNKRSYYFEISSTQNDSQNASDDITYIARFFYPEVPVDQARYSFEDYKRSISNNHDDGSGDWSDPENKVAGSQVSSSDMQKSNQNSNAPKTEKESSPIKPGAKVNLNYSIDGSQVDFTPLEAFDDTNNTYIRFADMSSLPRIYAVGEDSKQFVPITNVNSQFVVVKGIYPKIILENNGVFNILYNDNLSPSNQGKAQ